MSKELMYKPIPASYLCRNLHYEPASKTHLYEFRSSVKINNVAGFCPFLWLTQKLLPYDHKLPLPWSAYSLIDVDWHRERLWTLGVDENGPRLHAEESRKETFHKTTHTWVGLSTDVYEENWDDHFMTAVRRMKRRGGQSSAGEAL